MVLDDDRTAEDNIIKQIIKSPCKNLDKRVSAIESEITGLKQTLFSKQGCSVRDVPKTYGLGQIRTGDLLHVKAGDSAFLVAFSSFFAPFFATFPVGETTIRKASAPPCTV